ncbi:MAG: filamentous hemagglutinin N-terminal domain-containing protein [Verrucomicrobia bacterium]|nr:filamentous hemagglutinin N-terminal domain-containing protein [Verrucomicrobiota bacterium]
MARSPLVFWLVSVALAKLSSAAVTSDNSLGSVVSGAGNYQISGGVLRGNNLFHSLSEFNLVAGESAAFGVSNGVQNVLARVTGGASSINGRISCTANLFLMNPKGISFGPNATLDVGGAFSATTADYLKFGSSGDNRFYASLDAESALSTAPVSAFGFLAAHPAGVTFSGSDLKGATKQELHVVGGDIMLDGAKITAESGFVSVVSVGGAGEVPRGSSALVAKEAAVVPRMGTATLKNKATIGIDGTGGGRVVIRAGKLQMIDQPVTGDPNPEVKPTITANHSGSGRGGDIDVQTTESVSTATGKIFAQNFAGGYGGEIVVKTGDLSIAGHYEGGIYADNFGTGAGASIRLSANRISVESGYVSAKAFSSGNGGGIYVSAAGELDVRGWSGGFSTENYGAGLGGSIQIQAGKIILDEKTYVVTQTWSVGSAGNLTVNAAEIKMSGYSSIVSSTASSGRAGEIELHAENIDLIDSYLDSASKATATGDAGSIRITADDFLLSGYGSVDSSSFGAGNGGAISLVAKNVKLSGQDAWGYYTYSTFLQTNSSGSGRGGDITIRAENFLLTDTATVSAKATGSGQAGDVDIAARTLVIGPSGGKLNGLGGYLISDTQNSGIGGSVTLRSSDMTIGGYTGVFANAKGLKSGGNINILPGEVTVAGGIATISSGQPGKLVLDTGFVSAEVESGATGHGGNIAVQMGEVRVGGYFGGFSVETKGDGDAGNVTLQVGKLTLDGVNTYLNAGASGAGRSGHLKILGCSDLAFLNYSGIYAWARGSGAAGDIEISASRVNLTKGYILAYTTGGGRAGSVTLNAPERLLIDSRGARGIAGIIVSANPGSSGSAGRVEITGGEVLIHGNSAFESGISARSSTTASAGDILIKATSASLDSNGQITSANTFSSANALLNGNAGSVHLTVSGQLRVQESSEITTAATQGDAGTVRIQVGDGLFMNTGSTITASAAKGSGGNIEINALNQLQIRNSQITATAQVKGGNVAIDPHFVIVDHSLISAQGLNGGAAGNLTLQADYLFANESQVYASGQLSIHSVDSNLENAVGVLETRFEPPSMQLQERCAMRLGGNVSTFLVVGRGGVSANASLALGESAVWESRSDTPAKPAKRKGASQKK